MFIGTDAHSQWMIVRYQTSCSVSCKYRDITFFNKCGYFSCSVRPECTGTNDSDWLFCVVNHFNSFCYVRLGSSRSCFALPCILQIYSIFFINTSFYFVSRNFYIYRTRCISTCFSKCSAEVFRNSVTVLNLSCVFTTSFKYIHCIKVL